MKGVIKGQYPLILSFLSPCFVRMGYLLPRLNGVYGFTRGSHSLVSGVGGHLGAWLG